MKHIKKYNESAKKEFTKEDLEEHFSRSFDLCEKYEIEIAYFDEDYPEEMSWSHNDPSNDRQQFGEGYAISFHHNFWDKSPIEDFNKYTKLVSEINDDIYRFKNMCNYKQMFFDEISNEEILLLINP